MKQVVLIENDINTRPFSTQVLACLPPLPWTLSPEDLANPNRQDLRQVRVFSVDPPGNLIRIPAIYCYFMYLDQALMLQLLYRLSRH
jgi:exosome complex exonuclease DIS3/RRP44